MPRPLAALALVFATTAVGATVLAAGGLAGCAADNPAVVSEPDPSLLASLIPGASPSPSASPVASWALAPDQAATAARAGLPMFGDEVTTVHYHAHVDLLIRGEPVPVPALVGMDARQGTISPLHTHDVTGTVHIESPEDVAYTLGQFFTEWGQPLGPSRIGPVALATGEQLRVYRNGKLMTGDPAAVTFTSYAEYFIWVGPAGSPPSKPPATYKFPKGL